MVLTEENITTYIQGEIRQIQSKHNFDPDNGVSQLLSRQELFAPFACFQALCKLALKFDIKIDTCYDPAGLTQKPNPLKARAKYLYFIQDSNLDVWKIGISTNPHVMVREAQTHNNGRLSLHFMLESNNKTHSILKRYLHKRKTRDVYHNKGMWYNMHIFEIKSIINQLKTDGHEFMISKTLPKV